MAQMMMAMMAAKGKAKGMIPPQEADPWDGYVPGTYYEEPGGYCGVEGLKDAVTRAIEPHMHMEKQWSRDDIVNKICLTIFKGANKWYKDDQRHTEPGTAMQAQALL